MTATILTPEQKRAAVLPALSARSYRAIYRRVQEWADSDMPTPEQKAAVAALLTRDDS